MSYETGNQQINKYQEQQTLKCKKNELNVHDFRILILKDKV